MRHMADDAIKGVQAAVEQNVQGVLASLQTRSSTPHPHQHRSNTDLHEFMFLVARCAKDQPAELSERAM